MMRHAFCDHLTCAENGLDMHPRDEDLHPRVVCDGWQEI